MHEARIRMGKHSSSQVVQYVPVEQPAKEVITPAVAKSSSGDAYKAQQAQEQEQARQDFADILESVQMLTDEQIERAVFAISPTDAEKLDVARFFLQELHRRDEANALAVFRRWKRGENPEQPD